MSLDTFGCMCTYVYMQVPSGASSGASDSPGARVIESYQAPHVRGVNKLRSSARAANALNH